MNEVSGTKVKKKLPRRPHTLIVGGTRGIGRALVKTLVNDSHDLSVIGRHTPSQSDERSTSVNYLVADATKEEELSAVLLGIIAKYGPLNNLVFLQRYRGNGDIWNEEIATSLTATKNSIEILKDSFCINENNSIVVVNSIACHLIAREQPLSYHVVKAALEQLVRYYAVMLGPAGIRVNSVSLGTVLKDESKQFYEDNKDLSDLYKKITPLGRIGTAEEVSKVINFLCGSQASFVTGQNIIVDGGVSLQWHESLSRSIVNLDNLKVTRPTTEKKS